ncbi:MAG: PDZ domain-containing protein [Deltaproteobacteria bacterium]|nr:PDZ domain-containing protein [Deltaproteobacteria bacterium]
MRRLLSSTVAVTVLFLAGTAFAGSDHKCDKSSQDCLDALATKLQSKGWAGFETEKNDDGYYQIRKVTENSPAEAAGFQSGDVLLALNGVTFSKDNKEALKKVKKSLGPGKKVKYTVGRDGGKTQIAVKLAKVPEILVAQWIGEHMIDQHAYVQVASK